MRWGKPRKNVRRVDPRYFLFESADNERDFIKRFEAAVNELTDEELVQGGTLEEAEDLELTKSASSEDLAFSDEARKYMINFVRKRAMGVLSFKARMVLAGGTKLSMGALLPALIAFGYTPRKLWKMTSAANIDKIIGDYIKKHMPSTGESLYPGETDLKKVGKAIISDVVKFFSFKGREAVQKIEALPEPEQEKYSLEINQALEKLKSKLSSDPELASEIDKVTKEFFATHSNKS